MKKIIPILVTASILAGTASAQVGTFSKVGIGITSPANLLHIVSQTKASAGVLEGYAVGITQSAGVLALGADSTYSYIQSFNSRPLNINYAGNNTIMNAQKIGNVGIGTTAPLWPLHVVTNAGTYGISATSTAPLSDNSGAFLRLYNDGLPYANNQRLGGVLYGSDNKRTAVVLEARSSGAWTDSVSYPAYFRIMTTAKGSATTAERFRINEEGNIVISSGNVGIGTDDAKGYKLAVNGDAMFTKVKVKSYGSWPDYVFDEQYKLQNLAELETYVRKNKHLPEVPSAQEVEREGVNLGDNQAILLKKIEELTLHLIEMNQRVIEMDKRVQQLESENKVLKEEIKKAGK